MLGARALLASARRRTVPKQQQQGTTGARSRTYHHRAGFADLCRPSRTYARYPLVDVRTADCLWTSRQRQRQLAVLRFPHTPSHQPMGELPKNLFLS